jgi:two-component system sensor histidine kinase ChiS
MAGKLSGLIILAMVHIGWPSYAFASAPRPLGSTPNFSRVDINPAESVGEVLAITQDSKGFIWFAGRSGLARYDGYRLHTYRTRLDDPTALGHNYLTDVFEDSYGELWIATFGGGVARLNRKYDNFHTYRYQDQPGKINNQRFDQIYEDVQKNLWIVGSGGVAVYDREGDKFERHLDNSPELTDSILEMVQVTEDEYLFVTEKGIYIWNRSKNALEKHVPENGNSNNLPLSLTRSSLKDSQGNIWIGHEKGLYRFDPNSRSFESVPLQNAVTGNGGVAVWKIIEDRNGILWIATDGNGLMYYDLKSKTLGHYTKTTSPTSLGAPVVRTVFEDRVGDLWVSTFPTGIYYYDRTNNYFSYYSNFIKNQSDIYANNVWAFSEDVHNNLWLGVDKKGLVYFDRKSNSFSQTYEGFDFSGQGFPNTVLSLLQDSRGNLWAGTWTQGVTRFNLKTKAYTHFNPNISEGKRFTGDSVWSMLESQNGDIYFGTMNQGFTRYNYATDSFQNFRNHLNGNKSPSNNAAWSLREAQDGRIWIGTNGGVNVFDPATELFEFYKNEIGNPKSLSGNIVSYIYEDTKGRIWLCTLGGGLNLFHPEDRTFTHIRAADGLKDDEVHSMVEDNSGILWMGNTSGITAFDPENFTFTTYSDKNWLQNGEFSHGSVLRLNSGELAFGGANGFNIFNPQNISSNDYKPPIYFTELEILNQTIRFDTKIKTINKDIVEANTITLTHDDPMFAISFTALNYRVYADNLYRYKLVGFDKDWHKDSTTNKAIYTHMDPGRYQFVVMASNNNRIWSAQQKSIDIVVLPAPWRTWWAYCIYIGSILSLIAWFLVVQRNKYEHEKHLNAKLMELDKLKDDFMANTSHELRTPINGIIGTVQALQEGSAGAQSEQALNSLDVILACGRRLERLINDILDFSKSKNSLLQVDCTSVKLALLIEDAINECIPTIEQNSLEIHNTITLDLPPAFCDPKRTRQIFFNLIANAIKFTEAGTITISASESEKFISILVTDTGVGIAAENLSQLYKSFTQLTDSGVRTKSGTGLGLALAKYFIDAQGGQLDVESTPGVGSTFKVTLPKATAQQITNASSAPAEPFTGPQIVKHAKPDTRDHTIVQSPNAFGPPTLPVFYPNDYSPNQTYNKILVVDDETLNRMILRHILLKECYVVYEAGNGYEVIEALDRGFHCDLILLDIMMPKMSGTEACRRIRTQYSIQELPVIFVSAKSQTRDLVECFELDGNDFVSKPVNRDELISRVHAQLKLQSAYRKIRDAS